MNLSICIPAYNRPDFLAWTLEHLNHDFPDAEVIVSDDASPRRLEFVNCDRYIQLDHNIGPSPNHRHVLMQATKKYAVYCADDDYLLPEEVRAGIAYLDQHPECSSYIAPCEIWNEVEGKPFWNAFKCEPQQFARKDGVALFNFLIEHHVWPEHVIYRTPVPLSPRTRAYWCFADLVDLVNAGPIFFSSTPFYRNLLVHPVGERVQFGNVQCLTFFDEYRAGLDILAYGLFGSPSYEGRHVLNELIRHFICHRMYNASVLYERSGNLAECEMLRKRIAIESPSRDPAAEKAA